MMNKVSLLLHRLAFIIKRYSDYYQLCELKRKMGFLSDSACLKLPDVCSCPEKIFLYDNAHVYDHSKFIINPEGENGKFIMKKNSGSAEGLTVVTGNHHREIGELFKTLMRERIADVDKDVIVEEDVWIGANVTILAGVKIGRGSTIAANSVCYKNVPPYAIVMGNPAVVIGFNFTPEEIILHESKLYPENERIPFAKLKKNYERKYLNRINEIEMFFNN